VGPVARHVAAPGAGEPRHAARFGADIDAEVGGDGGAAVFARNGAFSGQHGAADQRLGERPAAGKAAGAAVRVRQHLLDDVDARVLFDAQLAVFDLRDPDAPCYACLYPEDGEVEEVQCSTMGVFAPLTGVVGAWQAMEAVKLLVGAGATLNGRLLLLDAKQSEWRTVRVKRDPACAVCSGA